MDLRERQKYFAKIYAVEADKIFRFVFLRVSDREEALDITEEVFYKFWQAICNGEKFQYIRAWLFTVARNKVIDWYKKKKAVSLNKLLDAEEGEAGWDIADDIVHQQVGLSAEAHLVLQVLDGLSGQYAEVVKMRFLDDLLPQEIAEVLNVSPNAVSLRLNHALDKLRKELDINIENKNE